MGEHTYAVPNKYATQVQQQPKLLECELERHKVVPRCLRIQVSLCQAREFGKVVNYGLLDVNVVVDKWHATSISACAYDRNSSQ